MTVRDEGIKTPQLDGLTEWVKSNPPEVVAARLKELDEALGKMLDDERDRELREIADA